MSLNFLFFLFSLCFAFPQYTKDKNRFLLVIEPAGTLQNPGRKLSDSFERGPTLQCAEALKKKLEESSSIEVILTRTAGSNNTQEQNAQIANRLQADLYLHLSFFHESEVKPRLFLYTFSYDNDFPIKGDDFFLCPYDKAHCLSLTQTNSYAHSLHNNLLASPYAVQPIMHIPYAPLKGITSPAIALEIGLNTTRDWRECIPFITQSITDLITKN